MYDMHPAPKPLYEHTYVDATTLESVPDLIVFFFHEEPTQKADLTVCIKKIKNKGLLQLSTSL